MTIGAAESCGEKYFDQFPSYHMVAHKAAQADHVQVVVLDPLMS